MYVRMVVADPSVLTSVSEMVLSCLVSTAQHSTILEHLSEKTKPVNGTAALTAMSVCRLQVKLFQTTCTTCLYSWSR